MKSFPMHVSIHNKKTQDNKTRQMINMRYWIKILVPAFVVITERSGYYRPPEGSRLNDMNVRSTFAFMRMARDIYKNEQNVVLG